MDDIRPPVRIGARSAIVALLGLLLLAPPSTALELRSEQPLSGEIANPAPVRLKFLNGRVSECEILFLDDKWIRFREFDGREYQIARNTIGGIEAIPLDELDLWRARAQAGAGRFREAHVTLGNAVNANPLLLDDEIVLAFYEELEEFIAEDRFERHSELWDGIEHCLDRQNPRQAFALLDRALREHPGEVDLLEGGVLLEYTVHGDEPYFPLLFKSRYVGPLERLNPKSPVLQQLYDLAAFQHEQAVKDDRANRLLVHDLEKRIAQSGSSARARGRNNSSSRRVNAQIIQLTGSARATRSSHEGRRNRQATCRLAQRIVCR